MIQQAKWIKEFCDKEGFNFIECENKIPCSLNRDYKTDNHTIFIENFIEGKKRVSISYGGLKIDLSLKKPINQIELEGIKKHCIPSNFICAKCKEKNLNLRTKDNHKTYVCPKCYTAIETIR